MAYLIVKDPHLNFMGEKSYGLVNLDNSVYTKLGFSMEDLTDVCRKARLERVAGTLKEYFQLKEEV